MKVFIYFDISIVQTGAFIDIFTYCNVRKPTVVFNPSISNQMYLEGKQGSKERLASNNNCQQLDKEKNTPNFLLSFVIVQLYNLGRSFVYVSVSKFSGVQILNFKQQRGFPKGPEVLDRPRVPGVLRSWGFRGSGGLGGPKCPGSPWVPGLGSTFLPCPYKDFNIFFQFQRPSCSCLTDTELCYSTYGVSGLLNLVKLKFYIAIVLWLF